MRFWSICHLIALLTLAVGNCCAQIATAPAPDEQSMAINTAIVPVPKLENDSYDWWQRHKNILAHKDEIHPQIVLIGDSITHHWGGPLNDHPPTGPKSWDEAFGQLPVLNLGFGYDRTQNVLWRLNNGEFDGLAPKWVVINIGTNNLKAHAARENTPQEIVAAIMAICDVVHTKSPSSKIIVMAVFPRGSKPDDPLRAKTAALDQALAPAVAARPELTYLDIGASLIEPDGMISQQTMYDGTHPTDQGYDVWAKALLKAGIRN